MFGSADWISLGNTEELVKELETTGFLKEVTLQEKRIVISYHEGQFGAVHARCNHMGGPLAKGKLKKGCMECPWHYWEFHHQSGEAMNRAHEPLASHGGKLSTYPLKIESGILYINVAGETERIKPHYNPMQDVAREPKRAPGPIRVLGISTTAMDKEHPRYSTSEELLKSTLKKAETELGLETQFLALSELNFRHCEGFYSKSEKACTWPCSITKMDPKDEMVKIYEGLVHWADVVLLASPIRWGSASSLYYKMAERLNAVQNQITLRDRVLIKDKVAGFIITGGQDNIQAVAGHMLMFFGELGFISPPFPFVAHSLGWSSEDMEANMDIVQKSEYLHNQSYELLQRSVDLSRRTLNLI
ncbi:(2Fe-2S)-binding protein [Bdellovibrio bacteriovorus]|uniref:(2Fe-2S)-binding protein n=1 Tax=Bdellovibrio bacteriovorus TaxID=959 RepID=A0A150WPX6_BDEBC|nr:Rieske 2Fe-2S domain-containing protein [Bdellovibrio bacteriovorus]KYG66480.1 (2Fe-2S)-binding protein [Bdellovibrio bacteriovorus]